MKNLITSGLCGLLSLLLVNLCSSFTGLFIPVGWFSLSVSGFLGIPGVITMVLMFLI